MGNLFGKCHKAKQLVKLSWAIYFKIIIFYFKKEEQSSPTLKKKDNADKAEE